MLNRFERQVDVFQAINHPARRKILDRLFGTRGMSAGHIAERFSFSRVAVRKHLRVLEESGLVGVVQMGRNRVYLLRPKKLKELDRWLFKYRLLWME